MQTGVRKVTVAREQYEMRPVMIGHQTQRSRITDDRAWRTVSARNSTAVAPARTILSGAIGKFTRASFAASVAGVSVELFETMISRSRA